MKKVKKYNSITTTILLGIISFLVSGLIGVNIRGQDKQEATELLRYNEQKETNTAFKKELKEITNTFTYVTKELIESINENSAELKVNNFHNKCQDKDIAEIRLILNKTD